MRLHGQVEAPAVADVAQHLVGRVQGDAAVALDEALRGAGPVAAHLPVLELDDDGGGPVVARVEQRDVAPGGGGGELVFDGQVPAPGEVQVRPVERARGQRRGEPRQRALPRAPLLVAVASGEVLKLADQPVEVVLDAAPEVPQGQQHAAALVIVIPRRGAGPSDPSTADALLFAPIRGALLVEKPCLKASTNFNDRQHTAPGKPVVRVGIDPPGMAMMSRSSHRPIGVVDLAPPGC